MFTVTGFLDGVYYTAVVLDQSAGGAYGVLEGSFNIRDYLGRRTGEEWAVTPTGPYGSLILGDPRSVLGALASWTRITSVTGDAPDLMGGRSNQPGVVY